MNSIRKLQLIWLLLAILGICVPVKSSTCPANCIVRKQNDGMEFCDCSGNNRIRVERAAILCQTGCFVYKGRCNCNLGTYGIFR